MQSGRVQHNKIIAKKSRFQDLQNKYAINILLALQNPKPQIFFHKQENHKNTVFIFLIFDDF